MGRQQRPGHKGEPEGQAAELERRLAEAQKEVADLRRSQERCQALVEERNKELERANQEVARLHHEKDALIAMVGYELRTPLVTGLGYLEMLLSGAFGPVSDRAAAKMAVARRNLSRLSRLIEDLLDYERLVLGGPGLILGAVDLNELLKQVRAEALAMRPIDPARIVLDVERRLPPAHAHRDMLRRALANLLDNSLVHGGKGCHVQLQARREPDGSIRICVSDDGAGISPELQGRAFDLFVKADEASEGRGLGLAIVRAIINAHGARVELRSQPGEGTILTFWLQPAPGNGTLPAPHKNA